MSTKTISDNQATLYLGVVTINEQRYAAILHFKTDEGENRLVTQTMINTRDVALKLFQDVITPYNALQVVEKVSGVGFFSKSSLITSHEDLKTEDAWITFVGHFESPLKLEDDEEDDSMEIEDSTHVQLVDLTPLDDIEDDKEFARALHQKIRDEQDEDFPVLTPQEKLFLQYRTVYQYPQFLAGHHNAQELNNLFLESQ